MEGAVITYLETSDASHVYRETTAISTIRMDCTADTGNLLQVMRDVVILLGTTSGIHAEDKIPEHPRGSFEAVSGCARPHTLPNRSVKSR